MMEVKCSNNPFYLLLEAPLLGFRVNPSKYVPAQAFLHPQYEAKTKMSYSL